MYILATTLIILLIKGWDPIKSVYNAEQDSFPHWKCAVLPCSVIALVTHLYGSGTRNLDLLELLWTFSIYLESIAILPQLMVLRKYGLVENLTGKFVFFLGLYRFLYILNWVYRAHAERGYRHRWVVYACGVLQTLLYTDFIYQYCRMSRFSRCCSNPSRDQDEGDVEFEGRLIFEEHRTNAAITGPATEGLLSESLDTSEDARQRRTLTDAAV